MKKLKYGFLNINARQLTLRHNTKKTDFGAVFAESSMIIGTLLYI